MKAGPVALGGYERLVEVSRDGGGVLFRGWDSRFHRHVAIHVLEGMTPEKFESARDRLGLLAGHPNVVSVHETGLTEDGLPYVVTDFFEGGSLEDLRGDDRLTWEQSMTIAVNLAGVVESARRAGITELVVDLRTVFLSRFGEPKLSTFGAHATGSDLASLEQACASLLGSARDAPEGFEAPTGTADPLEFAARLRQSQAEAGVAVTDMPLAVEQPVQRSTAAPDELTIGPAFTPRTRRVRLLSTLAAATVLIVVLLAARGDRDRAPSPSAQPSAPSATTSTALPAAPGTPVDPPLLSVDFSPDQWRADPKGIADRIHEDGRLRLTLAPSGNVTGTVRWRPPPEANRLSISLEATVVAGSITDIGLSCGAGLMAILRSDGSWTVQGGSGVVASGTSPVPPPVLGETFLLRMDCAFDRAPGRFSLRLNEREFGAGTLLGMGPGTIGYFAGVMPRATETGEIVMHRLVVRRLSDG